MNTQGYQLGIFSSRNTNVYKFCQILQGYIFHILKHFTTKLCNFTKSRMLFQDVVIFLPVSNFFKISSKRSIGTCCSVVVRRMVGGFLCIIQIYANFAGLYFPLSATFPIVLIFKMLFLTVLSTLFVLPPRNFSPS